MQAITDNLPAMVARFDRNVRYVCANARSRATAADVDIIGKSLPELRGAKRFAEFEPYVESALRGEQQSFETWLDTPNGRIELYAQFVPGRFKQINDTLGHAAGDEVLKEFAWRVNATVYDVDLVARLGGDEFVVLVEYTPTADAGERISRHLVEAMQPPILIDGRDVQVATSIGIGLHQPVESAAALMALADKALYEAKARGRNTWSLCRD